MFYPLLFIHFISRQRVCSLRKVALNIYWHNSFNFLHAALHQFMCIDTRNCAMTHRRAEVKIILSLIICEILLKMLLDSPEHTQAFAGVPCRED
jgi:hypothetical protein